MSNIIRYVLIVIMLMFLIDYTKSGSCRKKSGNGCSIASNKGLCFSDENFNEEGCPSRLIV